jgi:RNA polymerase sigma factor (sigma-70 family)
VYTTIRYAWRKDPHDAQDLTQEFFVTAVLEGNLLKSFEPERGSFRAFLRRAINYFMCETVRDANRIKRGGQVKFLSLSGVGDAVEAAPVADAATGSTPEQTFDLTWNQVVLARSLELLKEKLRAEGKLATFELFERYDLDLERKTLSYAEIGQSFGLSVAQVKHALGYARAAFRDVVIEVVRDYVDGPESLAAELDLLLGG